MQATTDSSEDSKFVQNVRVPHKSRGAEQHSYDNQGTHYKGYLFNYYSAKLVNKDHLNENRKRKELNIIHYFIESYVSI